MAKIVLSEELGHKLLEKKMIVEDVNYTNLENLNYADYLPDKWKDDEVAQEGVRRIVRLMDLINSWEIDQTEEGLSDHLRNLAMHILDTNR